jgi:hypothetical protein
MMGKFEKSILGLSILAVCAWLAVDRFVYNYDLPIVMAEAAILFLYILCEII